MLNNLPTDTKRLPTISSMWYAEEAHATSSLSRHLPIG